MTTSKEFHYIGALRVMLTQEGVDFIRDDSQLTESAKYTLFRNMAQRHYKAARDDLDTMFRSWLDAVWQGRIRPRPPDPPTEEDRRKSANALDKRKADGGHIPQEAEGAGEGGSETVDARPRLYEVGEEGS